MAAYLIEPTLEFEWRYPLDEPYLYDPADGNLLVDWIFGKPNPGPWASFDTNSSPTSDHAAIWTDNASNSQGFGQFTVVTQFTFQPVPEPALGPAVSCFCLGILSALTSIAAGSRLDSDVRQAAISRDSTWAVG